MIIPADTGKESEVMENTTMSTTTRLHYFSAAFTLCVGPVKRVITALTALSALGIGVAFATGNSIPYQESFEGWTPDSAVSGQGSWLGSFSDASSITNFDYTFTAACGLPLPDATHTNVLQLNTSSGILTDQFDNVSISGKRVVIDTMVNFVLNDGTPDACTSTDNGIKFCVFANASSNLVVYHGVVGTVPAGGALVNNQADVTSAVIDPANWYRLTVLFDATATGESGGVEMFQVKINGVIVTSAVAFADSWLGDYNANNQFTIGPDSAGSWFRSATAGANRRTMQAVAFQGTGYIDDLVVTPNYLLTVVNGGDGISDFGGSDPIRQILVASGVNTDIVYTATTQWYAIQTLSSNGSPVTEAVNASVYTQHLVGISADISNAVAFYRPQWSITQTIINGAAGSANPFGTINIFNGASTSIVYTANDWYYAIASAGDYGLVTTNGSAATVTFSTVLSNTTASATFAEKPTGAVVDLVPSSWAAGFGLFESWAVANSNTTQQGYMLNLNPVTMHPALGIAGIDLRGTTLYITVLLKNNGTPVSDLTINGTLQLYASSDAHGTFTEVGAAAINQAEFDLNGECVVQFTVSPAKFYRTEITLLP